MRCMGDPACILHRLRRGDVGLAGMAGAGGAAEIATTAAVGTGRASAAPPCCPLAVTSEGIGYVGVMSNAETTQDWYWLDTLTAELAVAGARTQRTTDAKMQAIHDGMDELGFFKVVLAYLRRDYAEGFTEAEH
jgi:hypothetical protein